MKTTRNWYALLFVKEAPFVLIVCVTARSVTTVCIQAHICLHPGVCVRRCTANKIKQREDSIKVCCFVTRSDTKQILKMSLRY